MSRLRFRRQSIRIFAILVACSLVGQAPAWAQALDEWSFVVTPQVWISHIAKNGFASSPNSGLVGKFVITNPAPPGPNVILQSPFPSESTPNEVLNPQWGLQLAAQKGRWTLAGAFQYVTFETRNDLTYENPENLRICPAGVCITSGDRWAQEFVDTTRMDVDLSASYFFPDVVKDRLDFSLGAGFKFIYATASRQFANLSPAAAIVNGLSPGLYTVCGQDDCSDLVTRDRVKQKSYLYGMTIPMNTTLHLTNDARWLLPFSITPLIGAETRNDNNVVYSLSTPATLQPNGDVGPVSVNRHDGTKFAYGVTADATLRWIINDTFSAYAGMRVQYIKGHEDYLAYGPLVGMSVRFGGK